MADFLFHEVSEKEKKEIKKQAKSIMDSFNEKLSKVKLGYEPLIERETGERVEGEGEEDKNFSRKQMFENAPMKKGDYILAEKKKW